MKLRDIIQPIQINDNWGKDYLFYVPQFISYAKDRVHVQEWSEDIRDQLFRSVNCISSLRMGNFRIVEREIIQRHWEEFIEPLAIIASNQDRFCKEESYQILRTIKRLINANRPAASLRIVAAFQPAQLTTTVTWYYLDEIYRLLKEVGVDMPSNYGGEPIEKSHYIQNLIRDNYPEVDAIHLGTYAWRLRDKLTYLVQNHQKQSQISKLYKQNMNIVSKMEENVCQEPVSAYICTTHELLSERLEIPPYQRPYVWVRENVEQMLNDIANSMEQGIRKYRIGSIILHQNGDIWDIVDGQQRITTISLIKRAIAEIYDITPDLPKLEYNHISSWEHISENYQIIKDWLEKISDKRDEFSTYLDENSECVVVRITGPHSLSLAFKVFDSQNGRGKTLEAYNLLKAYHLRAMSGVEDARKIEYDRKWENSTRYSQVSSGITYSYDILKHLFEEQLYRTRVWSRNKEAWNFSKKNIEEFKGMRIDKTQAADLPLQNRQLLLYMTEKFYQSFLKETMPTCSRFTNGDGRDINPFVSINDPIVNGEFFFNYTQTYSEIYKKLFLELDSYQLYKFKEFYKQYCLNYPGHWRTGDNYIREMYKSMIMLLFDRFGEKGVNDYYEYLYVIAYIKRIQNQRIAYQTVAKYPMPVFAILANAKDYASLRSIVELAAGLDTDARKYDKFTCFDEVYNKLF